MILEDTTDNGDGVSTPTYIRRYQFSGHMNGPLTPKKPKWLAGCGAWFLFAVFFISQNYTRQAYSGRPVNLKQDLAVWLGSADQDLI